MYLRIEIFVRGPVIVKSFINNRIELSTPPPQFLYTTVLNFTFPPYIVTNIISL